MASRMGADGDLPVFPPRLGKALKKAGNAVGADVGRARRPTPKRGRASVVVKARFVMMTARAAKAVAPRLRRIEREGVEKRHHGAC